jgi:guanosine-3',5'-bis(diphosphate) 3'-pyrophosphohydrolase
MSDPNDLIFEAAAFAARAHRNHLRKDEKTPYFSHPVRVCLVVRQVFGFDDARMLAAALLHDTIEDTNTDHDDLLEHFGETVAKWVSDLSKDKRLENKEREEQYTRVLAGADWQVKVIKLADLYDNMGDCRTFPADRQRKTASNSRRYLAAVRDVPAETQKAVRLVEERLKELESRLGV